ncbi:hypothetical protein DJ68_08475 [Halorubrum sp. C3]|nr:hypothetical protein DJ68_08475 [Halorubrum sp. C3]
MYTIYAFPAKRVSGLQPLTSAFRDVPSDNPSPAIRTVFCRVPIFILFTEVIEDPTESACISLFKQMVKFRIFDFGNGWRSHFV